MRPIFFPSDFVLPKYDIPISNYFDITKNAWATNEMVKALDDAVLL